MAFITMNNAGKREHRRWNRVALIFRLRTVSPHLSGWHVMGT